jgi:hypothetical protein
MRKDGDESKDVKHRKRPVEQRRAGVDERLMPKKRHPAVYTGMAFAILGGLMVAATFLVSWVDSYDASSNVLLRQLYVWDLAGHSEWDSIYFLAFLAPIAGAACAIISGTALANEKRIGIRRFAAMGVLATSATAAVVVTLMIWLLREQYIAEQLDRAIYGPAIFLSVFGCVLAVSGGIVLAVDYSQTERKRGTFATAPGSKHLKTALKPVKRGQQSRGRKFQDDEPQDREIREEMLGEEREPEATDEEEELSCPNCKSPVKSSWKLCPVCGEELG